MWKRIKCEEETRSRRRLPRKERSAALLGRYSERSEHATKRLYSETACVTDHFMPPPPIVAAEALCFSGRPSVIECFRASVRPGMRTVSTIILEQVEGF